MSYKTRDGKTHQSSVLISDSGLPVDAIATISGSYLFLEIPDALTYTALIATVTLPLNSDLTEVAIAKARYTGRYVLITKDDKIYYINRQSINITNRTFTISTSDNSQITPISIDLSAGWKVAEADIVNRLATTSSAKIDSIEFRDMHFQIQLDGDPVTVRGENGNTLEPNPDGSINIVVDSAGIPSIVNTSMATADIEYSIILPITAKRFRLNSREPATLKLAFQSGSSTYLTIKPGVVYTESSLKIPSVLTIYLKSNKPNTVIETVYWE